LENEPGEAIDAEGNLAEQFHTSKIGRQYLSVRERLQGARSTPEMEADIFNHLYTFFSRYYDEGDFMSLRRYSKRDKYAIPYNGEEVHLHWANSDQYYIKTGEHDYSYKHGWTV
jgi:adenine-specific DNA-methyltransferase